MHLIFVGVFILICIFILSIIIISNFIISKEVVDNTNYIELLNKISKYGLGKKFNFKNRYKYNITVDIDNTTIYLKGLGNTVHIDNKKIDWDYKLKNYEYPNEVAKYLIESIELYSVDELRIHS